MRAYSEIIKDAAFLDGNIKINAYEYAFFANGFRRKPFDHRFFSIPLLGFGVYF